MSNKLPAIQFYPNDWRGDIGVQSLSYHDRGVWLEILFLMHSSEQRGLLLLNGKPMPNEVLARHLALDKQKLEQTIENFISYGVASIDEETGALMNRRMVKDEHIRQVRKEAGAKGGNPNLLNQNSNQTASKKQPLLSSSSSSSSNGRKGEPAQTEPQPDYLKRKQLEYPKLDIQKVFTRYLDFCKKKQMQPKRRFFDRWLETEDEPMTASFEKLKSPDEVENEREQYRRTRTFDPAQIRL